VGTLRVTQSILVDRALSNLQNQSQRILELQTQLATGFRVNSPSDDPINARRAVAIRATQARNQQYIDNISSLNSKFQETSTTIQGVVENLRRTRELTLQGNNTTNTQDQLNQISGEVNQLLENIFQAANHITDGVFIFAGTRTQTPAFSATRNLNGDITAVTFEGNTDDIQTTLADGVTVPVNLNGEEVFQASQDVFQLLIDIRDNLRTSDFGGLQTNLGELNTAQSQLLTGLARIGSLENRALRISEETDNFNFLLDEELSNTIEADFAEVAVQLNSQSNAFQAALNATARVIQPSLLDFLR
jgi:flagellar hook-associated protein 3 FlgL